MKNKPIITITVTIIFLISIITPSLTLNPDGILLLSFKYSILEDPLHVLDSWSYYDDNPCSWRGIECNSFSLGYDNPRVVQVSLPQCQLLGSLPVNFGLLEHLQILILSSNSINGSIPDSLCSLPDIHVLDLSNNLISSELLESIGGLRSLEVIDVSENALAGNIPRNLGTLKNLSTVSLNGNYFSGEIPGGFDGVQFLDLSSNLFNGSLPVDFVGEEIKTFIISYNRF